MADPLQTAAALQFRALFQLHAGFVWRVLRRHGVGEAELEDVCQEVFMVVHRRLAEFEGRSNVRTWIYEIARRSALAQRRKGRRDETVTAGGLEAEDPGPRPDSTLEQRRALAWLHAAIAGLDADKREAFVLVELEEMSLKEAAEALGCAINTVHYRVGIARKELAAISKRSPNEPRNARAACLQPVKERP